MHTYIHTYSHTQKYTTKNRGTYRYNLVISVDSVCTPCDILLYFIDVIIVCFVLLEIAVRRSARLNTFIRIKTLYYYSNNFSFVRYTRATNLSRKNIQLITKYVYIYMCPILYCSDIRLSKYVLY